MNNNNFNNIISENDIIHLLMKDKTPILDSTLKWELYHYIKDNNLTRIGNKKYIKDAKLYSYEYHSKITSSLDEYLTNNYPQIKSIIWEIRQLNEWLNLLKNTNIIYIEIEKEYIEYIFSSLNDVYGKDYLILLNPNDKMISQYLREDLIVIKTLYSKSPLNKTNRKIELEKLIVDAVSGDYSLDTRGIEDIVLGIKNTYTINIDKMISYATRRRVKDRVMDIWNE